MSVPPVGHNNPALPEQRVRGVLVSATCQACRWRGGRGFWGLLFPDTRVLPADRELPGHGSSRRIWWSPRVVAQQLFCVTQPAHSSAPAPHAWQRPCPEQRGSRRLSPSPGNGLVLSRVGAGSEQGPAGCSGALTQPCFCRGFFSQWLPRRPGPSVVSGAGSWHGHGGQGSPEAAELSCVEGGDL